jgi:biotin carboxylase
MKTLHSIQEIRDFFKNNNTPIYFISATCFNLLGIEQWVNNFKFIVYIDSFKGENPTIFSPKNIIPHNDFNGIEDINNYLLQHPEVIAHINQNAVNGNKGKALFLMFDEKTEQLAHQLGLEVCFPSAQLRSFLDNKVNTNRIAEKAGVKCVPYVLSNVKDYNHLLKISSDLGTDLVIQTPFGDSGHTTFFIKNEDDFNKHKEIITSEREVKIMKRINCYGTAIEGCVTKNGTFVGPLMTELVGFKELTPYKGGWCGNEILPNAFNSTIRNKAQLYTEKMGNQLYKEGYKGYFELDFLIDKDSGEIYLGELNPRVSGVSSLTNHAKFAYQDVPLFLFHLLEWLEVPHSINPNQFNTNWSLPENIDSWSQLVIKHTRNTLEYCTQAPDSGIWEMKRNGNIVQKSNSSNRQNINTDAEAFWFNITYPGDYLYEGADLGILILRGRLMTDDFQLTERAKLWIKSIRNHYKADIIDRGNYQEEDLPVAGDFKIL